MLFCVGIAKIDNFFSRHEYLVNYKGNRVIVRIENMWYDIFPGIEPTTCCNSGFHRYGSSISQLYGGTTVAMAIYGLPWERQFDPLPKTPKTRVNRLKKFVKID